MAITAQAPYQFFTETDGTALESGNIYIGTAGLDAETNPISIYWDAALTIAAAQPIRTIAGVPDNAGTPSDFFSAVDYSITVKDSNGVLVYSKLQLNANDPNIILGNVSDAITPFMATVLDDAAAADARLTLGAGVLDDLLDDTTPQLGGSLDANSFSIDWAKGADVSSAAELLLLRDGNSVDITGTTTVTSIENTADAIGIGALYTLHFDDAVLLTHHATDLVLIGGADITTAAGDTAIMQKYASGDWRMVSFSGISSTADYQAGVSKKPSLSSPENIKAAIDASVTTTALQASTSGTAIDFTSIPAGVTEINVLFDQVGLSGTNDILVQIGDVDGIEATGYSSASGSSGGESTSATGMVIRTISATRNVSGIMRFILADSATNLWISSHSAANGGVDASGGGRKALSAELTQLRVTVTGANTFDLGNLNIVYR